MHGSQDNGNIRIALMVTSIRMTGSVHLFNEYVYTKETHA